jgi:hypothetical protein
MSVTAFPAHPALHTALREWAAGLRPVQAAVELLIRGGFATGAEPWVCQEHSWPTPRAWVDFERLPELVGGMSDGEISFLRLAASIAADVPVILGEEVAGLDRRYTELLLAALAHAAGFGERHRVVEDAPDGTPTLGWSEPLAVWPEL